MWQLSPLDTVNACCLSSSKICWPFSFKALVRWEIYSYLARSTSSSAAFTNSNSRRRTASSSARISRTIGTVSVGGSTSIVAASERVAAGGSATSTAVAVAWSGKSKGCRAGWMLLFVIQHLAQRCFATLESTANKHLLLCHHPPMNIHRSRQNVQTASSLWCKDRCGWWMLQQETRATTWLTRLYRGHCLDVGLS